MGSLGDQLGCNKVETCSPNSETIVPDYGGISADVICAGAERCCRVLCRAVEQLPRLTLKITVSLAPYYERASLISSLAEAPTFVTEGRKCPFQG